MTSAVYIAVPSADGKVEAALSHLLGCARAAGCAVEYYLGYRPTDYMRNSIFRDFMATKYEWLWMIDADILPPANALELLAVRSDIVTGEVTGHKGAEDGVGIALRLYRRGAGCMMIHRRVLDDHRMRVELDPETRPPDWSPAIYKVRTEPWGKLVKTGDIDFCERAERCGYSIVAWDGGMFGQRESLDLRDVAAYGAHCAADAARVAV